MTTDLEDSGLLAKGTDKWYERCLKLMARVDWRGLAIVLAAVAGIVGAVWNKLDAVVEKALAARTQQGVYEVLADKLDDLSARLVALEGMHAAKGEAPRPATPRSPDKPIPGSETGQAPKPVDAATVAVAEPSIDKAFTSAQLPSFQTIQKHAVADELPLLLRRDPPVAAAPPPGI